MSSAWVNTKVRQGPASATDIPSNNSNNNNGMKPATRPAALPSSSYGAHNRSGSAPAIGILPNGSNGAASSSRHSADEAKRKAAGGAAAAATAPGDAPHHINRLDHAVIDGWIDNVSRATAAVGRGGLNPHDVRSLAAIPNELSAAKQYVKTNEAEIVATIKAMEIEKRSALETIALRREAAIQRASEYYGRILDKQARLRRQMLTLEAQKTQSTKDIKRVEEQADRFQKVLTDFDVQRKQMVSRVRSPGWSVAHHYHLTALDHFEGKLQPALIDVGSMIRGHLRVCAFARRSVLYNRSMAETIHQSKVARDREGAHIGVLENQLKMKRPEAAEIDRIVELVKKRYGDEIARHKARMEQARRSQQARIKNNPAAAAVIASAASPTVVAATGGSGNTPPSSSPNSPPGSARSSTASSRASTNSSSSGSISSNSGTSPPTSLTSSPPGTLTRPLSNTVSPSSSPPSSSPATSLSAQQLSSQPQQQQQTNGSNSDGNDEDGMQRSPSFSPNHNKTGYHNVKMRYFQSLNMRRGPMPPMPTPSPSTGAMLSTASSGPTTTTANSNSNGETKAPSPPSIVRSTSSASIPSTAAGASTPAAAPAAPAKTSEEDKEDDKEAVKKTILQRLLSLKATTSKAEEKKAAMAAMNGHGNHNAYLDEKKKKRDAEDAEAKQELLSHQSSASGGDGDGVRSCQHDWSDLRGVVEEMDAVNGAQQRAWEELETVLDRREYLMSNIDDIKREWERETRRLEESGTLSPSLAAVSTSSVLVIPVPTTHAKNGKQNGKDSTARLSGSSNEDDGEGDDMPLSPSEGTSLIPSPPVKSGIATLDMTAALASASAAATANVPSVISSTPLPATSSLAAFTVSVADVWPSLPPAGPVGGASAGVHTGEVVPGASGRFDEPRRISHHRASISSHAGSSPQPQSGLAAALHAARETGLQSSSSSVGGTHATDPSSHVTDDGGMGGSPSLSAASHRFSLTSLLATQGGGLPRSPSMSKLSSSGLTRSQSSSNARERSPSTVGLSSPELNSAASSSSSSSHASLPPLALPASAAVPAKVGTSTTAAAKRPPSNNNNQGAPFLLV